MRRQRGFTLMEILIAMALTSIVTTSVLAIVRTQLTTFEQNDQIMRTQSNARAAMDYIETYVRRACGGVAAGSVAIDTPTVTKQATCLQTYDAAGVTATAFSAGSNGTTTADAIEIIYGTGTMTALSTALASPLSAMPASLSVYDITGFAVNDYVLVSDNSNGYVFQIGAPVATGTGTTRPIAGTLPLVAQSGSFVSPTTAPTLAIGSPVFKAASYSFFIAPSSAGTYASMLMVDPNGVMSNNHIDYGNTVQPAVEGAVDFQVAVGADQNSDGAMDLWYGAAGEALPATPWGTGISALKQVRLSLLVQTMNSYPGASPPLTTVENRTTFPSTAAGNPRYRAAHMIVAPRAWNLDE